MPGPEPAQQAHAAQIRELTQNRREDQRSSPEEKLERMIQNAVNKGINAEVRKLKFNVANGIRITGQWPTFTISKDPGVVTGTLVCNGSGGGTLTGTVT